MVTFDQFSRNVRAIAFPELLAENLVPMFRTAVVNCLIECQTFVPCLRDTHVDFHCQHDLTDFCGAGIINGPRGVIQQIYAFKPGTDCKKYFFERRSTNFIECWIDRQRCANCEPTDPPAYNLYEQPYCELVLPGDVACADPYTPNGVESDTCFKHAERYFAIGPDYRLYLAPRIPCGYVLGVQWEGIKRCWKNADAVPDDEDLKKAAAHYCEAEMGLKDREMIAYQSTKAAYLQLLKHMAYRCKRERRLTKPRDCSSDLIDSVLPWVTPLSLSQPYDAATCFYNTDSTPPVIACE